MTPLTSEEKRLIYHLSGDLGDSPTPYADLAHRLNSTEAQVLATIGNFTSQGLIRRLGATLWHQRSGFTANAMVVFRIPEHRLDECGTKLATYAQVSHCYQRCPAPVWPFNLYAMVHAHTQEELLAIIKELAQVAEAEEWRVLESLQEFKKSSMRYFADQDFPPANDD